MKDDVRYAPALMPEGQAPAAPRWHPEDARGLVAPARRRSGATAIEEVLKDIDATVEGLREAGRCGMFANHERECETAVNRAIELLTALEEAIRG